MATAQPAGPLRRRATSTRSFGSGKRENHDASGFYGRFQTPEISQDADVRRPAVVDRLFCGDAAEMTDAQVADRSVALVVTSPPYFAGKEYERDLESGAIPSSYMEYLEKLYQVLAVAVDKLEPGGRVTARSPERLRMPFRRYRLHPSVSAGAHPTLCALLPGLKEQTFEGSAEPVAVAHRSRRLDRLR